MVCSICVGFPDRFECFNRFVIVCHLILPSEVEGSEQVPVPFRYDINPLATKRTIIYRPNPLQGEPKTASLGAVWAGKYEKLPSNKIVDVVWEVLQLLFPSC